MLHALFLGVSPQDPEPKGRIRVEKDVTAVSFLIKVQTLPNISAESSLNASLREVVCSLE